LPVTWRWGLLQIRAGNVGTGTNDGVCSSGVKRKGRLIGFESRVFIENRNWVMSFFLYELTDIELMFLGVLNFEVSRPAAHGNMLFLTK